MAVYEELPLPSVNRQLGEYLGQDELLYSEARYTQKGITLPRGNGTWSLGTVMAECITPGEFEGLYFPFGTTTALNADGSTATIALGDAEGLLRHTVNLYPNRGQFQNLMISGIAKLEKVSGYTQPALDSLGAVISVRRSTFKF
jgi:hypothetical protein